MSRKAKRTIQIKKMGVWLIVAGVLASAAYLYFIFTNYKVDVGANVAVSASSSYKYFSRLDGLPVESEELQLPEAVGIIIDNHPDAYPQSGLNEAKIVYEAPAEGGITRYLAFFDKNQTVEKVGPVRSARPYYMDWLNEYGDALYMHCGGSPAALDLIKQENIFDANEFSRGGYFQRDYSRAAPHNLFTNSELWQKLFVDYGDGRPVKAWDGWQFDENFAAASPTAVKEIKIIYGLDYEVVWKYNSDQKYFERSAYGRPHLDSADAVISARNIIVQFVKTKILDEIGRREIATIGSGEARFLRDGGLIQATWKKESAAGRTVFFDAGDNEIKLKPGKTWVEVVPVGTKIEITN